MGGFDFELAELMGSLNQSIERKLSFNGKEMGILCIKAERVALQNNRIYFNIHADNVKVGGCFSSCNPFVKFARPRLNDAQKSLANQGDLQLDPKNVKNWQKVYESEHKKSSDVIFKNTFIDSSKLCYSLQNLPIKVSLKFKILPFSYLNRFSY